MSNENFEFSEREKEVIESLLQGKSNKQIALALSISENTVEYHLKNIYKKLQVSSRTEAVLRLGKSVGGDATSALGKSVVETNVENANNGVQPISTRRIPLNKSFLIIGSSLLALVLLCNFIFINMPQQVIEVTPTPTSDEPLPDLVITSVYVSIVDKNGNCLPYFGVNVTVVNQGNAPAVDVYLAEMNTGQEVGIGTLDVFESITMPFVAKSPNGLYNVVVDPRNTIEENDEFNNSVPYTGITATPPIFCLSGQIETATSTPLPLITTPLPQQYFIPMFSPPTDWHSYTNANPAYEIYYPSNAQLTIQELDPQIQSQLLTINLPVELGTQMLDKYISIQTRSGLSEGCYANGNGVMQINGIDFAYQEGVFWNTTSDDVNNLRDVFQSHYSTINPYNGFCYYIVLQITKLHDSSTNGATPLPTVSRADASIEILLNILSTLTFH